MQQEPKSGPNVRMPCLFTGTGRVRPEEVLRRKLMQKMLARQERRAETGLPTERRAG